LSKPSPRTARQHHSALLACAVMLGIPFLLFRVQVLGDGTWIGNPDRLNNQLKLLLFYARGIAGGQLAAWNEHEMLGYDSFVMPGIFPGPTTWLSAVLEGPTFLHSEGWVNVVLLVLTGFAALAFLRRIGSGWFEAVVGAACYQLCGVTILRVSQYDISAAIVVLIPLALILVREARKERAVLVFLGLVAVLVSMLLFTTLQSVAYAVMLIGAYAAWRGLCSSSAIPVVLTAASTAVAVVIASPRLLGNALAIRQYSRMTQGVDLSNFDGVYQFQNIRPYDILRWFDGTIFGISPSDAHVVLLNSINLTEGTLLATSAAVPLLFLFALPRFRGRWGGLMFERTQDTAFWFWILLLTVLAVVCKPLHHLLYLLFLRVDFTHARILLVGVPAMCALVAIVLTDWNPGAKKLAFVAGLVAGLLLAAAVGTMAGQYSGATPLANLPINVRLDSVARIAWTGAISGMLALVIALGRREHRELAGTAHAALGSLIVVQAFWAADVQVNGPQARNPEKPFYYGDMYMAGSDEFLLPTARQIEELRMRVGNDRVVLVCDREVAGGFCAGHLSETWRLRSVDGYYGVGVPDRIRKLPWGGAEGVRTISFAAVEDLPWPLLGFLNVRKAVIVSNEFFKNHSADGGLADVARLQIIDNPAPVLPRAFLAASADGVADAAEAAKKVFDGDRPRDVQERSFVEGLAAPAMYDAKGEVAVAGSGDRLEFDVSASSGNRLLVVNELYFPGWRAFVDGHETPLLAANAVMRAVVLPPNAKSVVMTYQPFARTRWAIILYLWGSVLLILGVLAAGWAQKSARSRLWACKSGHGPRALDV
jgi:hypothetical protein